MNGLFTDKINRLSEAIVAIRQAAEFDWAISLQWGPFYGWHLTDEGDPRNLLHLYHDFSNGDSWWFKRGILPRYAKDLIIDDWSYYLGFNAVSLDPHALCEELKGDISPRTNLFEIVASKPCVYVMRVDDWWWEAYTSIADVRNSIADAWGNRTVSSDRWEDGRIDNLYPFPETAR